MNDGATKYYAYVCCYTDDCLVISDRAETLLRKKIGKLLGGKLGEVELDNGQQCWVFGCKSVEAAVQNAIDCLKEREKITDSQSPNPTVLWISSSG